MGCSGQVSQAPGSVMGNAITHTQLITRSAPSEGVTLAPATYPMEAAVTAPSNNRSAWLRPNPWPCWCARNRLYAATSALPRMANSQKPRRARWCISQAATAAVASGNNAVITAAWLAVTSRNAQPSSSGYPIALPSNDSARGPRCSGRGRGERVAKRYRMDRQPARAARPQVTNQGESCGASAVPVARRVMGKVRANTNTPTKPSQRPSVSWCFSGTMTAATVMALLLDC